MKIGKRTNKRHGIEAGESFEMHERVINGKHYRFMRHASFWRLEVPGIKVYRLREGAWSLGHAYGREMPHSRWYR